MSGKTSDSDVGGARQCATDGGRRLGLAVAVALLAAMLAIALLGLVPHSARGAGVGSPRLTFKQIVAKVRAATRVVPVFVVQEAQTRQPAEAIFMDRRRHLAEMTAGKTRIVLTTQRAYVWTPKTSCWKVSRIPWNAFAAGVTAWNSIAWPVYSAAARHTVSAHRITAVFKDTPPLGTSEPTTWDADTLTFNSSWRATEHLARFDAATATSGGATNRHDLSYPSKLPPWVKVPTSPFCGEPGHQ